LLKRKEEGKHEKEGFYRMAGNEAEEGESVGNGKAMMQVWSTDDGAGKKHQWG